MSKCKYCSDERFLNQLLRMPIKPKHLSCFDFELCRPFYCPMCGRKLGSENNCE